MSDDPVASLLARTDALFARAGEEYCVVGRAAARLWGSGEEPSEVDVVARLDPGDVDELLAAARSQGWDVDAGLAALAAEGGDHLTLFPDTTWFVDVKPARGAGDLAALRTRVEVELREGRVQCAALEETVARLLDEGSEEALRAARRVLERHKDRVDLDYLGQRCEELGVLYLLHELRGEPTVPSP